MPQLDETGLPAPECTGMCITGAEVGVPTGGISYAYPGCPAHDPEPAPVDCDHLWRKLPDLRAWLTREIRSRLDIGEQWRRADPNRFAEQVATHLAAGILPVLDHWSVARAHKEYHRLGLIPTSAEEPPR